MGGSFARTMSGTHQLTLAVIPSTARNLRFDALAASRMPPSTGSAPWNQARV